MDWTSLITWYWLMASVGSTFLGLRLVAMLLGVVDHDHGDGLFSSDDGAGGDGHAHDVADGGADDASGHDGFKLLSLQSLAALCMGTGWLGVALHSVVPWLAGLILSGGFGFSMMLLMSWMMSRLRRLEDSGTFRIQSCFGRVGTVYSRIPRGGTGQVQVEAQGRLVTMEATCDSETLETGRSVLVYGVTPERVLEVEPHDVEQEGGVERLREVGT